MIGRAPFDRNGTGLGLFIANKIIEQHGGNIKVDSKPNLGSSFKISILKAPPNQLKPSYLRF